MELRSYGICKNDGLSRTPGMPVKTYYASTKELAEKFREVKKKQDGTEWKAHEIELMTEENNFYKKVVK